MGRKVYINGHYGMGLTYGRETGRDTTPKPIQALILKRRHLRSTMFRLEETRMYCRSMEKKAHIGRKLVEMEAKLAKLDRLIAQGA